MSIPLSINGQVFEYPVDFDENWGVEATGWAQAVTNGMLQMQGGSFPLTADVNFGPNFGLLSEYFETRTALPAANGVIRLAKTDVIDWRNNANSADNILSINSIDQLLYNGVVVGAAGGVTSITGTVNQIIASASTGAITLSTPQDINTTSSPTFNTVTANLVGTVTGHATLDLALTGGTMSGAINMGSNKITNVTNGSSASDAATFGQIPTNSVFPGEIRMYGGASAPTGWLLCDGTSYTTAGQPALFAIIGYTFGGGGANFNVPNLTDRVPVGAGSLAALGVNAGSQTHTLTQAELPVAIGTASSVVTDPTHNHQLLDNNGGVVGVRLSDSNSRGVSGSQGSAGGSYINVDGVGAAYVNSVATGVTVATTITNAGGGSAHSIVQPVLGITFIIKA